MCAGLPFFGRKSPARPLFYLIKCQCVVINILGVGIYHLSRIDRGQIRLLRSRGWEMQCLLEESSSVSFPDYSG